MQRSQLDSIQKYNYSDSDSLIKTLFFKFRLTPCKAEPPLRGMELQEKEAQKDSIQEICLERN